MIDRLELDRSCAGEMRNQRFESTAALPEPKRATWPLDLLHCFLDFLLHPLCRQPAKMRCAGRDGTPRRRVDLKAETSGKSQRSERTQPVFAHALFRVAHRLYDLALQISLPVERVLDHSLGGRIGNRIDSEISPREVVYQRRSKLHLCVAPIGFDVAAERRHFV